MATAPRKIQTPGEQPKPDDDVLPPAGGDQALEPPSAEELAERVAQLTELTAMQAEQLQAMQADREAREANSQAGKIKATQRTSELTQEQALAQANKRKRSVLSRDGWVCPSEMPPLPPQVR